MNQPILSTLATQCNRQRLLLVSGFVLMLAIVLFNSVVATVDVSGWSSGFIHPLHGGDHFLTMLAVGIWAAQLRGKAIWLLPVTFVSVMSLGGLAGAAGLFIPGAEPIILLSCLVFSIFIARKIRFSNKTSVIIVAFFAFFHGFAHGQEISTSASLISYTLGFMVATLLLHSAGILIVRLLVMIFALFISHLALAQSSTGWTEVRSPSITNDGLAYLGLSCETHEPGRVGIAHLLDFRCCLVGDAHPTELIAHPSPPDSGQYRQRLYSGEDSDSNATGWAEVRSPSITNDRLSCITSSYELQKPVFGLSLWHVVQRATINIAAKWLSADWLDNQRLGIHFLTGVGKTSPPVALMTDSPPRFCSTAVFCHSDKPITETIPRFDLHNIFYTLATSFLTNGTGATSPPVWLILFSVASVTIVIFPPGFTALFISRLLVSSNLPVIQTRLKSRSPPFVLLEVRLCLNLSGKA